MEFFDETIIVANVPIMLNKLMHEPPELPHEYVKLLADLREGILSEQPNSTWKPGAENLLYLWQTRWFANQKKDVLESNPEGTLCETITGCIFNVLSAMVYRGVLTGAPRINIFLLYNASEFGRDLLCLPNGKPILPGWSDELSLDKMMQLLYYVNKRWFNLTYGHHQVMKELFPALLTRLLNLYEMDDEGDPDRENNLWMCEAYLRRLWWPITLRSEFNIVTLSSLPHYDPDIYRAILGAVQGWVQDLMLDQNPKTMSWFRREVLKDWELPCIREIASRVLGTHRHVLSSDVIKRNTPVDLKRSLLNQIATNSSQQAVYNSEPSQIRQGLILVNVIANARIQFDLDLQVTIKSRRHLWDIAKVRKIANSSHAYILQMAGSYMAVWDGFAFVSRTIEEAIAQMLFIDQDDNLMRDTLLAMGFPMAEDDSSAHLLGFHETTMAITL